MFIFQLKLLICMCYIYNAGPPICQSLEIDGLLVEGQRLSFNAAYSGGCDSENILLFLMPSLFSCLLVLSMQGERRLPS